MRSSSSRVSRTMLASFLWKPSCAGRAPRAIGRILKLLSVFGYKTSAGAYAFRARLDHLEQAGRAHAAADAHRHDDVLHAAALAFDERVADEARSGDAVGMAHRDRAAVHVEALVRDAELVAAVDHLHRERLVQLPQADVADLEAGALEQLRDRVHGPDAHFVGLAARDREAAVDAERLQAALCRGLVAHDDLRRG